MDSVETKPASLLVLSLGKAFNGMPSSLCGKQVMGPSRLPVVVAPVQLKTPKPSVNANVVWPIYTSSCIMLTTNSSIDEELDESTNITGLSQLSPFIQYISNGEVLEELSFCKASILYRGEDILKIIDGFFNDNSILGINVP